MTQSGHAPQNDTSTISHSITSGADEDRDGHHRDEKGPEGTLALRSSLARRKWRPLLCSAKRVMEQGSSARRANSSQIPEADSLSLFNHLVGAGEEGGRDSDSKRPCGAQIDYKFDARRQAWAGWHADLSCRRLKVKGVPSSKCDQFLALGRQVPRIDLAAVGGRQFAATGMPATAVDAAQRPRRAAVARCGRTCDGALRLDHLSFLSKPC
jgi:hypothetical protein